MREGRGVMILSFFFSPGIGGVETHLNDLCDYLRSIGRKTWVVTFQPLTSGRKGRYIERSGSITVYRLPSPVRNMFYRFQSLTWLRFMLLAPLLLAASALVLSRHRNEIGVVHAHDLNSALATALVSSIFGTRSVLTVHYVQDYISAASGGFFDTAARQVLSGFDSVIAVSERVGAVIRPLLERPERMRRMTYWIDLSLFSPEDRATARKAAGFDNMFTALYAGRLVEVKGVNVLLEACKALSGEDMKMVFAGEGPLEEKIREAARTSNNTVYAGPLNQRELRTYYSAADIVVVPSVYEEGFGRVAMEAIACGTPVLGSNRGAMPEVLAPSVGLTVEPSPTMLASALRSLLHDPDRLRSLGGNCRHYAESHFSVANAKVITDSYDEQRDS